MSLYPVIMCGGSGVRLWPLSRPELPKPFARVLGGPLTAFQETAQRAAPLGPLLVIAGADHGGLIREQLAALSTELSLAEERERQNIAAILHDHIGQMLLLVRIKLGTLADGITPESEKKTAEEAKALLDQVTHDIHNLTVQMNPPILDAVGLEAALEWLGRRMEEDYGLFVEFEEDLKEKPLRDEVRSVVYQCGRELLVNVAKHAGTDHARILVAREDDRYYRLTVEDDGAGFDLSRIVPDASRDCRFGLISIQIRMERMGGSVAFESAPGEGSRMTLLAPLACKGVRERGYVHYCAAGG